VSVGYGLQHDRGNDGSDAVDVERMWGLVGDGCVQCGVVGGQLGVEGADAPGKADRLAAADRAGGGGVLVGRQAAIVAIVAAESVRRAPTAEGHGAQQRGERIDRARALAGHVIASGGEDTQDGSVPGVAGWRSCSAVSPERRGRSQRRR
jgi:hypothetical protein